MGIGLISDEQGVAYLARNLKFESISLQRRVGNEPCGCRESRLHQVVMKP